MRIARGFLAALVLATLPAAAGASTINGTTFAEVVHSYGMTQPSQREQVLDQLRAVCASKYRSDQRRCKKAMEIIERAAADLANRRAEIGSGS